MAANPFPTIDAHHHLWHYRPTRHPGITPDIPALKKSFTLADLDRETAAAGIDQTVAIQAQQSLDEGFWLLGVAEADARVRGVVTWAPIKDPAFPELLLHLKSYPGFCGVREIIQYTPIPEFLQNAEFDQGIQALTALQVPFDLLISIEQFDAAIDFVDRHPSQVFIFNHLPKPVEALNGGLPESWASGLRRLAERPNVFCKFSGLINAQDGPWTLEAVRPYFDLVLEAFSAQRLMFGSNWPVCLQRAPYIQWVSTVRELTETLSVDEQRNFWSETAARAYGLNRN